MEVSKLSETQLLNLKEEIEREVKIREFEKLDTIKRKDSVRNKTKLSQLTCNDRMFGIGFSLRDKKLHFIGYCDVHSYEERIDGDARISVGHKKEPFGVTMTINKETTQKHYFSNYSFSSTMFFTLKPETWQEDLQEDLKVVIGWKRKRYREETKELKDSVKNIIKEQDRINDFIKKGSGIVDGIR